MRHGGNVWEGGEPCRWLDFSANLRPEGPPAWVLEALHAAAADARYYPDRHMSAARMGLAAYLGLLEENILPTAGGAEAIDLSLSLRQGTVWTEPVTFGEYAERAAVHGRKAAVWKGYCEPGDTVVRCNPNNPTGCAQTREALLKIARHVAGQGGELMVDEAFIDFCSEHTVRHDGNVQLIVVGSLTKTLCIPGVRLGYVAAEPAVIAHLERLMPPWSINTFAAAIAAALPQHRQEIADDTARNQVRRDALATALTELNATVLPSETNFLLVDFHRNMTRAVASLKSEAILVRTCASFGLPDSFLRLAVRTEEENARLIDALRRALGEASCVENH